MIVNIFLEDLEGIMSLKSVKIGSTDGVKEEQISGGEQ